MLVYFECFSVVVAILETGSPYAKTRVTLRRGENFGVRSYIWSILNTTSASHKDIHHVSKHMSMKFVFNITSIASKQKTHNAIT